MNSGAGGYASTTHFHSSSAPGTYLYHETTAALRRLLVPEGWESDELDGQPRVWNPNSNIAVVVQTGDENTGIAGTHQPRTRNPKGFATQRKIEENRQHPALFMMPVPQRTSLQEDAVLTWVLLVAIVEGMVRAELSLPREFIDGRPADWVERILLAEQDFGGSPDAVLPAPETGPDTDFDVVWQQ
ncbi:hypothetical protein GCM10023350_36600 [Nocardioides endophyticus]|uniref:Restriction endonuclease n=1 Tax=Nocardioides endophyticus TaxID=1353775 RepID=A0ABP8Z799_9ACTN